MRSRPYSLLLGLLLGLLTLPATAKNAEPEVISTPFEGTPTNLLYFEDSDIVLVTNGRTKTVYRSEDGGAKWKPLDGVEEGEAYDVVRHPYDRKVAVVVGNERNHWITRDRGDTWRKFSTREHPVTDRPSINFHADDPDRILFHARACGFTICEDVVYYTTDGFESNLKRIEAEVFNCIWAKSTNIFTTGDRDLDKDTVLCMAPPHQYSITDPGARVLVSSDYFETGGVEPVMSDGRPVGGVTNLAAVKGYIVFAAKSPRTTELSMQVTTDTKIWHRAELGEHRLEKGAYTLLESTNYSMQVDIMDGLLPMGTLLTSESNGTFFSKSIEHTNRNEMGFVDFEKVSNIQGIVLVNLVDNGDDLEKDPRTDKKLRSKISFDDGRSWSSLRVGDDDLHLHSVTDQKNVGRIFSSPAPGVVMGVGNTGDYLRGFDEGNLYVSHDAGLTWKRALEGPHLYEFGASGSVLVAVEYGETDVLQWSLDYGQNWEKKTLSEKVKPWLLTTTPDSTSLKFLMMAMQNEHGERSHYIYSLDFDGLHEDKCRDSDLERWHARTDKDGKPQCIMGHTQSFLRRKLDADCLVVSDFEDPKMETEDCKCTELDFECDYNFVRDGDKCKPIGPIAGSEDDCKDGEETFKGTLGYRLIPGNTCVRDGGIELDKEKYEWSCNQTKSRHGSGKVSSKITEFSGDDFDEVYYRERTNSNSGDDETVIMRTNQNQVYLTKDHGKNWKRILEDAKETILAIYPHQYMDEIFYLITDSQRVYYSTDRGSRISHFDAPDLPNRSQQQVLRYHPTHEDWLIWLGGKCSGDDCENVAYVSRHQGNQWDTLETAVHRCQFVYRQGQQESDELVYCEKSENERNRQAAPFTLWSSTDWFDHKTEVKRGVVNFAVMAEYIVVAMRDGDEQDLKVDTSIDGVTFADARFPRNFQVQHQEAYTVLDSSTHAVFLHVTVNSAEGQEYGSIIKSNSNGTSYALSVSEVNRNSAGYVDFEKMQGLEGVSIINRVGNVQDTDGGKSKKLKTYITHNDGAAWALLPRPEDPPRELGEPFECQGSGEDCSLHLHGFTERKDPRNTFGSPSAIGIMFGTGNVGKYLERREDSDTFMTTDGGVNWQFVRSGTWMWEFGDQGSVMVIVKEDEPTKSILYTLDEGKSWEEYEFSEESMRLSKISTVPSDTSLNFLLWGKRGDKLVTVNLDFSGLPEREELCKLDDDIDYNLWTPKHPLSDDECLFGHVAQYHRKMPDRSCFNGRRLPTLHDVSRNCSCTRRDFECNYNYEPDATGGCRLVEGAEQPDPAEACAKDPELDEYNGVSPFRRIPLTTCEGGLELDTTLEKYPCKGHEEEYKKKHGISGAGLFFAITLPIAAAAGVGYWVWQKWDGKFGRIRLGESGSSGSRGNLFDRDAPWIRFPVMALSGIVAVIATLPMLVGSLWRVVSTRLGRGRSSGGGGAGAGNFSRPFTSRSSFARGRGNYAVVDPDESELLGPDSDEEV